MYSGTTANYIDNKSMDSRLSFSVTLNPLNDHNEIALSLTDLQRHRCKMALSRGCNLECVDDYQAGDEVIEFVGPVKIILVDPPKDAYRRRVLGAAWITLAHMFMGASVMTMLYYSLSYRTASIPNAYDSMCLSGFIVNGMLKLWVDEDRMEYTVFQVTQVHKVIGVLCFVASSGCFITGLLTDTFVLWVPIGDMSTISIIFCCYYTFVVIYKPLRHLQYHFFAAQAILSLNYANGWSTPMRLRHRRLAHVLLQMCGMAAAITGTVLITISKGFSTSPHGITGVVTAVLALISLILGPLALFGGRYLKIIHASFGIPTFIMSSICLCLGLFTSRFQDWASSTAVYILTVFVIFYTCFIMIASFIKCTMRI
ncbi:unnamed protein product [Leptidea sinapis]|uniref:ascorbate ferrireductase (transmembrane) n=1 Tax=Leptidea sinapis TaxID=189913 RepID=A0A5E4Q7X2_9NEOP|nr:unnamed protein product [Leptidea sinapis]